ncbi:MAG: hypothetical protein JST54_21690 [Deltaproteobacteria bacterium]|nr:hypothetical protein [Deltaproteobacteria bacterium]
MRDRLPLLALALALVVATLAVLMVKAGARGEFAEPFSTYRSEPDGARALFLLAQQAGLPVERRHVDMEAVEGTPELVMLGIEGDEPEKDDAPDAGTRAYDRFLRGRLGEFQTKAVLDAVDRGATLIYAVTRDHPFLGDLGVTFTPAEDHLSRQLVAFSPTAITEGVGELQSRISGYLSTATPASASKTSSSGLHADALPLLVDRHHGDQAVALLLRRGQGRVLVMAAPTMASNRELAQGDAARFWLNALTELQTGSGKIEFDEYHHGFTGERSLMGYAARYGLPWAIAQGVFALALWSFALRRFGAARPIRESSQRATADYLLAMARIYRLGGHRQHAAGALVRGALRALQGMTRAHRKTDVQSVAATLEATGQHELAHEIRAIASRLGGELSEQDLLVLARRAAYLRLRASSSAPSQPTPGVNTP